MRPANPQLDALIELVNFPDQNEICPDLPLVAPPGATPSGEGDAAAVEAASVPSQPGSAPAPSPPPRLDPGTLADPRQLLDPRELALPGGNGPTEEVSLP